LFENVLNCEAGAQKADAAAVHSLEQLAPCAVYARNSFEVDRDPATRIPMLRCVPAAFKLRHEGACHASLDFEDDLPAAFFGLNLHHRLRPPCGLNADGSPTAIASFRLQTQDLFSSLEKPAGPRRPNIDICQQAF